MTCYCVTVDVMRDGHSPLDPAIRSAVVADHLAKMCGSLSHLHATVDGDCRGWSAAVTIDADTLHGAREVAVSEILGAADKAGLPTAPVVRVEAVREDIRNAELERPTLPDLVSEPEVAVILGISQQRVCQLSREHPGFPKPVFQLHIGPLWLRAGIERFDREWERGASRPSARKTP